MPFSRPTSPTVFTPLWSDGRCLLCTSTRSPLHTHFMFSRDNHSCPLTQQKKSWEFQAPSHCLLSYNFKKTQKEAEGISAPKALVFSTDYTCNRRTTKWLWNESLVCSTHTRAWIKQSSASSVWMKFPPGIRLDSFSFKINILPWESRILALVAKYFAMSDKGILQGYFRMPCYIGQQ